MIWDYLIGQPFFFYALPFLFTFLMTMLIYKRCINAGFVYDDHAVIREPGIIQGKWWDMLKWSPRSVVTASYALNFKLSGQQDVVDSELVKTRSFHLINICLHFLNTLLLFGFAFQLGISSWGLLFSVGFLLVTPIAVNAVANIAGRSSLVSTSFQLLALLSIVTGHALLSVPFVVLAIFSKQDMVVLPLEISLLLLLLGNPWWWLAIVVPMVMLGLGWMKFNRVRELLRPGQVIINPTTGWPPMPPYMHYMRSFVTESMMRWPRWLLGWGYSISPSVKEKSWLSFLAACGAILIVVALLFINIPLILKVGLMLFIVSPWWTYVAKQMPDIILEHRAYASCVGLALIVGYLSQYLPVPIMSAWLVMLAMKTHERAGFWTPTRLFEAAIEDGSTKPMILLNHSSVLIAQNRLVEAAHLIEQALEEAPDVYQAWGNLGTIHAMQRNAPAMLACYRRGAMRCKRMPLAWSILVDAYDAQGRSARALAAMKHLLSLYYKGHTELPPLQQKFSMLKQKNDIMLQRRKNAIV